MSNKGISLIVLIITIVVIVILTGAIVLNIVNNNPITKASESKFKMDTDTIKSDLSLRLLEIVANNQSTDLSSVNGSLSSVLGSKYQEYDTKYTVNGGTLYSTNVMSSDEYAQAKALGINMRTNLTNMLVNSDFSQLNADGITPKFWNIELPNGTQTCRAQDGKMYLKGVGGYNPTSVVTQYNSNKTFIKDEIYYFRVQECFISWDTNIQNMNYGMMFGLGANRSPAAIYKTPNNLETTVSFRYTIPQDYVNQSWGFKPTISMSPNPVNLQNIEQYITKPLCINLTASFGKGNEPSEQWCNDNIPFFITNTNIIY